MTIKKIEFTVNKIIHMNIAFSGTGPSGPTPLFIEVNQFKFPYGTEEVEIKEMQFSGGSVDEIKTIIKKNKTYQMDFENSKVKDERKIINISKGPEKLPANE